MQDTLSDKNIVIRNENFEVSDNRQAMFSEAYELFVSAVDIAICYN